MSSKEIPISLELQHQAVKLVLPDDLLGAIDEVLEQAQKVTAGNANWLSEQAQKSKRDDLYGHDMSEFSGDLDVLEKSGLEAFNFKIDSTGWKIETGNDGIVVKVNPEGDIWEYVSGVAPELIGEQIFTWESAMRETGKCGKTLPTKEEWEKICEPYGEDVAKISQDLGIIFAGIRNWSTGNYNNQSLNALYWSSSPGSRGAYYVNFNAIGIFPATTNKCADGFSVRCMNKK